MSHTVNVAYLFLVTYREYSCMSCHIGSNAEFEQGVVGGQLHEALKKLTFPLSKASTECIILL
jgi:hypothetical protein